MNFEIGDMVKIHWKDFYTTGKILDICNSAELPYQVLMHSPPFVIWLPERSIERFDDE